MAISHKFVVFLDHCHKRLPEGVTEHGYWNEISNGSYIEGTASERKIRKAMHRFIYRLIIFSINQKKKGGRVPQLHVFFLWCIITTNVLCPLPYCVAYFLVERSGKSRVGTPIYSRMLVTKLARSFEVFDETEVGFLTSKEGRPFQPKLFKITRIVKDLGKDTYSLPKDDLVVVPTDRRNVRLRVERWGPRHAYFGDELPIDPYHIMAKQYNVDLRALTTLSTLKRL